MHYRSNPLQIWSNAITGVLKGEATLHPQALPRKPLLQEGQTSSSTAGDAAVNLLSVLCKSLQCLWRIDSQRPRFRQKLLAFKCLKTLCLGMEPLKLLKETSSCRRLGINWLWSPKGSYLWAHCLQNTKPKAIAMQRTQIWTATPLEYLLRHAAQLVAQNCWD